MDQKNLTGSKKAEIGKEDQNKLINRLRRIEGQVKGLQKMIKGCRDCEEVARQISSTRRALSRVLSVLISAIAMKKLENSSIDMELDPEEYQKLFELLVKYG